MCRYIFSNMFCNGGHSRVFVFLFVVVSPKKLCTTLYSNRFQWGQRYVKI